MSFAHFDLSGRAALVTGGSTGLGEGFAVALAGAGARVLISGRDEDKLNQACASITREAGCDPGKVTSVSADLYSPDGVSKLSDFVTGPYGGVDIFAGNAGAVHAEQAGAITQAETDACLQLNLVANIQLTEAFLPQMRAKRWGRIIFSSSTASALCAPMQGNHVYAATKSGLNGFARTMAGDLGRDGITINNIIFGVFWTSILRNYAENLTETEGKDVTRAFVKSFEEMTAVGRLGEVSDLHGLVQLLASDAGSYLTGVSIPLDGGTSIMMRPFPS
jgi:NAD(P)-dependent dehydrogenase (short-subunit alcohol dehydrogenase family)